ncbi:MAG: methylaspartate mutase subunit S [Desulfitobacterium sp.]
MEKKGIVITGTIGADTHVIGTRIVQHACNQAGYEVVPLGAFVSQEEFVRAAVETNADAIMVSSIYGQAELDCANFREKFLEVGLDNILLYLGGNICAEYQEKEWPSTVDKFKAMGFNRVYPPGTSPSSAIKDLEEDLALRKGGNSE